MAIPEELMNIALNEAQIAFKEGEVPVGAVLYFEEGSYISDHNRKVKKGFFSHAEFNVLQKGLNEKKDISKAILYVTLEPCLMCIGAMIEARIKGLVYGAEEPKYGGIELLKKAWNEGRYPHKFPIYNGLLKEECSEILERFFSFKRKK